MNMDALWPPYGRIRGTEHGDTRTSHRCREVRDAAVVSNIQIGAGQMASKVHERIQAQRLQTQGRALAILLRQVLRTKKPFGRRFVASP